MFALALSGAALVAWAGVLLLPWQPHRTRERLEPRSLAAPPRDLDDVTVLIPARDEAAEIGATLAALARQGPNLRVLVIDDQSSDETADVCAAQAAALALPAAEPGLFPVVIEVLSGRPLPAGWGGKLWALEQGLARVDRRYVLLLDADIELKPAMLPALLAKALEARAELVSIMARLNCTSFWEKLLAPPFVFFFKLLYPFARVNTRAARAAAAAGGCVLVEADVLRSVGGFAAIRGALIDDCALAARLKRHGCGIWLGLSRAVVSRRSYPDLASFWRMVSRTAFTQLEYSAVLLALVAVVMGIVFLGPLVAVALDPTPGVAVLSALALAAMAGAYWPTLRFYELARPWCLTLPLAGVLFLAMTVDSALNYWRGVRAYWKSRAYVVSGE